MDANMQLTINSFRQLFPDKIFPDTSLIFSKIPDISLTAVKFPDISRFTRQVVTQLMPITKYGLKHIFPKKCRREKGDKITSSVF